MINYLPYALRQKALLDTNDPASGLPIVDRVSVSLSAMAIGGGQNFLRNFLQDLQVYVTDTQGVATNAVLMRMGWEGKGFLTEDFYPIGMFHNKARPQTPVWEFIKPYRLFPGQGLRARFSPTGDERHWAVPSIVFDGVKSRDGMPYPLHSTRLVQANNTMQYALDDKTLWAPSDSPIDLYSVSISDIQPITTTGPQVQIYGPDQRAWFNYQTNVVVPAPRTLEERWIDPLQSLIELGEERGWVMERDETLMLEFMVPAATGDFHIWVTLRGSLEVDQNV